MEDSRRGKVDVRSTIKFLEQISPHELSELAVIIDSVLPYRIAEQFSNRFVGRISQLIYFASEKEPASMRRFPFGTQNERQIQTVGLSAIGDVRFEKLYGSLIGPHGASDGIGG